MEEENGMNGRGELKICLKNLIASFGLGLGLGLG